jgi:hypothetical protein
MKIAISKLAARVPQSSGSVQNAHPLTAFASVLGAMSLFALIMGVFWMAPRAPAGPVARSTDLDLAMKATLAVVLTNAACPQDPQALQDFVAGSFVLLWPDLLERESRKDPAFVKAEEAAFSTFLHPDATFQALMADPRKKAEYQEAIKAIVAPH